VALLQTEALVLRVIEFGESDRIVHLLAPDSGRLTAIAKGARRSVRRFPGTLDLFNHLRVHLDQRRSAAMARLDQATLIRAFPGLRADAARFALGCYLLELLDRLAPESAPRADARRLFAFALAALDQASGAPLDPRLRPLLELRLLDALGLRPELRRCVRCGEDVRGGREPAGGGERSATVGFHVAEGGPVCARCAPGAQGFLPVQLGTLRALESALRLAPRQQGRLVLGPRALEEARTLLARFHRFHLGVELRSERVLDELLPAPAPRPARGRPDILAARSVERRTP
jgi:DNA repair protein RecO (recombination protein O)